MKKIMCEKCGAEEATSISFFHNSEFDEERREYYEKKRGGKPIELKAYTLDQLEEETKRHEEIFYDRGTRVMFCGNCTANDEDYYITLDRLGEYWLAHMRGKNWWTFEVEDQYRRCVSLLPRKFHETMLATKYPAHFAAGKGKTA